MLKGYILEFQNGESVQNAGSKAPADMSHFLESNGYQRLYVQTAGLGILASVWSSLCSFISLFFSIKKNSIVITQYPIYSKKGSFIFKRLRRIMSFLKGVQFIALIHDIRSLQTSFPVNEEIKELNSYSSLIVHSTQMTTFLRNNNCIVPSTTLGFFDYHIKRKSSIKRVYSKEICFAGNLAQKSFIANLPEITSTGVSFYLYGRPSYCSSPGLEYCGSFDPDDVSNLKGSWGLVWDGDSINGLVGKKAEYQKYNSPHKASLYIVAGLPIITHKDSAISALVEDNNLGVCVNSLNDISERISKISETQYQEILYNVNKMAGELMLGNNIIKAIDKLSV